MICSHYKPILTHNNNKKMIINKKPLPSIPSYFSTYFESIYSLCPFIFFFLSFFFFFFSFQGRMQSHIADYVKKEK